MRPRELPLTQCQRLWHNIVARAENVAELVNAAGAFHEQTDGGSLAQFLEQVALVADPDTIRDGEGAVRLMTVHTAKGLEFPVVVGNILQCYCHEWHCYLAASGVDCVWPNRGIPMLYAAPEAGDRNTGVFA